MTEADLTRNLTGEILPFPSFPKEKRLEQICFEAGVFAASAVLVKSGLRLANQMEINKVKSTVLETLIILSEELQKSAYVLAREAFPDFASETPPTKASLKDLEP